MINKVNKETYTKVLKELMLQRIETTFWKGEYERQQGTTFAWFLTAMIEFVIFGFILFIS